MKLTVLIVSLATLIALGGPAGAEEGRVVDEIIINGNQALSDGQIRAAMELTTPGWKFWTKKPPLDRSALFRDRESILKLYRNNGYYQAKAEVSTEETDGKSRVIVEIKEGLPVIIREVNLDLTGFGPEPPAALVRLTKENGLVKGRIFRLEDFEKTKDALVRYLAERAHPRPDLTARVRVSAKEGWAEVNMELSPGPLYRLGEARFEGHRRTKVRVMLNEIPWDGGEPFDQSLLDELRRRLMALRVFTSVRLEPIYDQADGDRVPIRVSVVERKPRSFEIGVGYGNEDKLRVRGSLIVRSTLGLAEVFSIGAHYSSRAWGGLAGYRQPHFLARGQNLAWLAGHGEEEEVSFSNTRSFSSMEIDRPFFGPVRVNLGGLLEYNRPFGLSVDQAPSETSPRWVVAARLGAVYDTRDDPLDPQHGTRASVRLELAPRELGSELSYYKIESGLSHHRQINPWLTLGGKLRAATIATFQETEHLPIYKRFFLGGSRSVRGYPYQKMGPLDDSGFPVGGKSLVEMGLEARFPVWGSLGGVVFAEAGNLSTDSWRIDPAEFRYTVGVGLRYKTIIGPLSLDLGYQLNPPESANFSRFQVHFNVGQAF